MGTYCQKAGNKNSRGLHAPTFVLIWQGVIEFFNSRVDNMSNTVYIFQPVILFSTSDYYIFRNRHNK